jgi:hypothetical protein
MSAKKGSNAFQSNIGSTKTPRRQGFLFATTERRIGKFESRASTFLIQNTL